jgi:Uma2 family endonuclease
MAMTKLWTADDVERLPDDDFRYALINGVLYQMPPTKPRHGRIVSAVGWLLHGFAAEHSLGTVYDQSGFLLQRNPDVLLSPDLAFVRQDRVPTDEDVYPLLAPDLVVEVASPSQTGPSIEEKTIVYLAAGVQLVWIIDPAHRLVRVMRAEGTQQVLFERDLLDGEDILPGFHIEVARLFA